MSLTEALESLQSDKNYFHHVSDIQIHGEVPPSKEFASHALRKFYGLRSVFKDDDGRFVKIEQSGCELSEWIIGDGKKIRAPFKEKSPTKLVLTPEGLGETWTIRQRRILAQPVVEVTVRRSLTVGGERRDVSVTTVTYAKREIPRKRFVSDRFVKMLENEVEYSLQEGGRKIASPGKPTEHPAK